MRRYRFFLIPMLLCVLVGCNNSWSSGDRVLVAKFLYDSHLLPPHRYDVVVFKFPKTPIEKGTPKNYIKRLLGLPGELIAIFFGRLYSYTPEKEPFDHSNIPPNDLWKTENMLIWSNKEEIHYKNRLIEQASQSFIEGAWQDKKLTILRKPLDTIMALRRIVYDNDKQARDLKDVLPPRWQPWSSSPWTADEPNGFKIEAKGDGEQWLRYQHILRPTDWPMQPLKGGQEAQRNPLRLAAIEKIKARNHPPQLITDVMGYNTYETPGLVMGPRSHNWVGDLMLEFHLTVTEAKGECWVELSKGVDRFQARINLETGECTLFRLTVHKNGPLETVKMASATTKVKTPGSYEIRFANIDERLTLWVGSDRPFNDGQTYEGPKTRGPDFRDAKDNNDLQPASIASKGASIKVHHLKLWRDTYYTRTPGAEGDAKVEDWFDPSKWNGIREMGYKAFYVYPGHYLCLGDNSPESSDSRDWGLVPERLMLGRALVVYFPFERIKMIK